MGFYVQNVSKPATLVPDGEYKARVTSLRLNEKGDTVIVRCEILTEGFEKTQVTGFCGAHWHPSTRTTANLRQWCINLGMNVVSGHEEELDLEELKGKECRIIVQSYRSKTGEDRCKVSNILPLDRRIPTPTIKQTNGLHIGQQTQSAPAAQTTQAPAQAQQSPAIQTPVTQAAPVQQASSTTQAVAGSESSDDELW